MYMYYIIVKYYYYIILHIIGYIVEAKRDCIINHPLYQVCLLCTFYVGVVSDSVSKATLIAPETP